MAAEECGPGASVEAQRMIAKSRNLFSEKIMDENVF
jgi:hypothetical protein